MFGNLPAYGFYCRHAENLTFNNIELDFMDPDVRPAMVFDDIIKLNLDRIDARVLGSEPLIKCKNVRNLFIQSCTAPTGIDTFLQISGNQNDQITLIGNDLSGAKNAVNADDHIDVFLESNRMK